MRSFHLPPSLIDRCWLAAACVIAASTLAACLVAGAARSEPSQAFGSVVDSIVPGPAPADTLDGGCSGGVTGGGNGVAVTGRGEILEWTKTRAMEPTEFRTIRTDSAAVAAIFAEAERTGFRTIVYSKPWNVTCFLSLTDEAGKHTVAWPLGDVPQSVRELNRRLHALMQQ